MSKPATKFSKAISPKRSLLRRAIIYTAIIMSVVIGIAGILNYWQVYNSLRSQALDQLKIYTEERGIRESGQFSLAEDNLNEIINAYLEKIQKNTTNPSEKKFNQLFLPEKNGIYRTTNQLHSEQGISGLVANQVEINPTFQSKIIVGYELLHSYGPAWKSRFINLYMLLPETSALMYWPENSWGLNIALWDVTSKQEMIQPNNGAKGKTQWSNLYYDYGVGHWVISASRTVKTPDKGSVTFGIDILLDTLFDRTLHQGLEGTYNMIIRDNGDIIAHPKYMDALLATNGLLTIAETKDSSLLNLLETITHQSDFSSTIITPPNSKDFFAIAQLQGPSWYLITVYPSQLIQDKAQSAATQTLLLHSIALALGLLMMYLIFKRLIRKPLLNLVKATEQIADGHFDTRVKIKHSDEIGQLGNAFNKMTSSLHEALTEKDYTQDLIRQMAEVLIVTDAHGKVKICNPSALELLGYSEQELSGKPAANFCPELHAFEDVISAHEKPSIGMEMVWHTRDGKQIPMLVSCAVNRNLKGNVLGIIILAQDRSKLYQTQEALKESEERFANMFKYAPTAVTLFDMDKQCWFDVNENTERLYGFSREQLLQMSPADVSPEKQPDGQLSSVAAKAKLGEALQGGHPIFEWHHTNSKKEIIICEVHLSRFPGSDRNLIQASILDITERKRTEQALKESEQRYSRIAKDAPEAITLFDPETAKWIDVNESFERLFGYDRATALTMGPIDIAPEKQPNGGLSSQLAKKNIETAIKGGSPIFEWQAMHANGTLVECEIRLVGVPWGGRTLVRASVTDIAERKRAQEELKRSKEAAEAANRAKSQFLANMSHEFRTPLNAILGFTQLNLNDSELPPALKENLTIVKSSGEHLLGLINDVLEMSKVEAGHTALNEQSFNLYEFLNELAQMFKDRAKQKGLGLALNIAKNLPIYIKTDPQKLRQVLTNIIGNALKFTSEGSINLYAEQQNSDAESPRLSFQVKDTGCGIPTMDMKKLFDPSVQLESSDSQHGTGLGLSISHQFVRLMGGEIQVESTPGKGSTFSFYIRAQTTKNEVFKQTKTAQRVLQLAPNQKTIRILIVEDELENRLLLRKILESAGFVVQEAENGLKGIELFQQWSPDLVFMDMRMPVMDGYQATGEIKAIDQESIIIALTASVFEEQRISILACGCDELMHKPCSDQEIFSMIAKHLNIQYVYQDLTKDVSVLEKPGPLQADDFVGASKAWCGKFQQAAKQADAEQLETLVDGLGDKNQTLKKGLRQLIADYRYDEIRRLLSKALET